MKTSVANAIILSLCVGSGVHSFTPAEPPKRMKSDFADFVTRSAYGPQYTSQAKAGGTSSILMPSGNSTEFRNFYDVLGVDRDDEFKDIKRVYRKKAKEYHPDLNPGEDAIDLFQDINRAYEVLSDPELRKAYDWYGELGIGTSASSDDIFRQEAIEFEYEEFEFGEVSSSFSDCLEPKAINVLNKEKKKAPQKKRRYMLHHPNDFKQKFEKKKEESPGTKRKRKSDFAHVHSANASFRNLTP